MSRPSLSFVQLDRAIGAVVASAVGDALGAGYEFAKPPLAGDVRMLPGTLTGAPAGHWTDDTAMALGILVAAAEQGTLDNETALARVGDEFLRWFNSSPRDVGMHTAHVLQRASTGGQLPAVARAVQEDYPDAAGNGALMRTGPVALAALGDDDQIARTARSVAALTHPHDDSVNACVLWSVAIGQSILRGTLVSPRVALHHLPEERRGRWAQLIDEAEASEPSAFTPNGWVVTAFQAAWSSLVHTTEEYRPLEAALRVAVSIGDDTDTVAAIAGALGGAAYGLTAVPFAWRHGLAGWPGGLRSIDLVSLAAKAVRGGNDPQGWPDVATMVPAYEHFAPRGATYVFSDDPGVIFGDVGALASVDADAFLSLCRIGVDDRRTDDHEVIWLIDRDENLDAPSVLADTADAIAQLRSEGRTVFVHCVRAESRTPTVAMAWLLRHHGYTFDEARRTVLSTITSALPEESLLGAVHVLAQ